MSGILIHPRLQLSTWMRYLGCWPHSRA
ncbi:hypothetical protein LOK49_Contig173G00009 [Camellia lanceoleosa]|nr:hypothetical protein LOK49_Contig173G00009 [Camellia lanceoleosa]